MIGLIILFRVCVTFQVILSYWYTVLNRNNDLLKVFTFVYSLKKRWETQKIYLQFRWQVHNQKKKCSV